MSERKLLELLNTRGESQVLEFKQAGTDFSKDKLGEYISALSNEAGLQDLSEAWLLLGVKDDRTVCGTSFLNTQDKWNKLLNYLSEHLSNHQHPEIIEVTYQEKRVLMVRITPPPIGTVIGFKRHYYGRDGESLVGLHPEKHQQLLNKNTDWSVVVVEEASLKDLDPQAIEEAKKQFKIRYPQQPVDTWDISTFLNKAHLTIQGKITRTALLLLGKSESTHFLQPADPFIRWRSFNSQGIRVDQGRFGIPFLLTTGDIARRIQNPLIRHIPAGKLFEEELERYQPYSIREALHNCIAHQEYRLGSLVDVTEYHDRLVFANRGDFIPRSVELVVEQDSPPIYYRNKHLANAMANLRMVDTMGGGIRKLFEGQKDRGFPLPDYDITNNQVKVTLMGQVMDERFQKMLTKKPELSLKEVILLDKVQKKKTLSELEVKVLRDKHLIEGRKPNYYLSQTVSEALHQKASYTKNKGFEKKYYLDLILQALTQHGSLSRKEIDELLISKLPEHMNTQQKKQKKIANLLTELRQNGYIENQGSNRFPTWALKVSCKLVIK